MLAASSSRADCSGSAAIGERSVGLCLAKQGDFRRSMRRLYEGSECVERRFFSRQPAWPRESGGGKARMPRWMRHESDKSTGRDRRRRKISIRVRRARKNLNLGEVRVLKFVGQDEAGMGAASAKTAASLCSKAWARVIMWLNVPRLSSSSQRSMVVNTRAISRQRPRTSASSSGFFDFATRGIGTSLRSRRSTYCAYFSGVTSSS